MEAGDLTRRVDSRPRCVVCLSRRAVLVDASQLSPTVARWIRRRPVLCDACVRRLRRRDVELEERRG